MTQPHLAESIFGDDGLASKKQRRSGPPRGRWRNLVALLLSLAVLGGGAFGVFTLAKPLIDKVTASTDFEGPGGDPVTVIVNQGDSGGVIAETKILDDFYKGRVTDDDTDDEAEADSVSEAWLVWSTAQDQFPAITEKVLRMQDMVHSTRSQRLNEHGSVTCYVATASGVDAFATSDTLGERILTPLEALHVFRADPDTPTAPLRTDHFQREMTLVQGTLHTGFIHLHKDIMKRSCQYYLVGGSTHLCEVRLFSEGCFDIHILKNIFKVIFHQ